MTSAINTSARMVRLSMQVREVAREPDRNHRDGTDDSARSVAPPAMSHARRRVSEAPQWHMRNSLDNSGTTTEAAATAPPDTREPSVREACASELVIGATSVELRRDRHDVITQ